MHAVIAEYKELDSIIALLGNRARVEILNYVHFQEQSYPIHQISLGTDLPNTPTLAFFGGIHGLEKIGTEVLFSYLNTLGNLLQWDEELRQRLTKVRLVFVPMLNPVGIMRGTRCNGNGIDLMRNAPLEGNGKSKLHSGHRISPKLPWFRGTNDQMELEAQTLCEVVRKLYKQSSVLITVDLHSGFGIQDRLWFPYAYAKEPFSALPEAHALKTLMDTNFPHHFYKIEPVSEEYIIHGDLWDYLYLELAAKSSDPVFLPLTLEMGSWQWLRKNPLHLFHRHGLFHPVLPHRHQRILRRHLTLFEFLFRAVLSPTPWAKLNAHQRKHHNALALKEWYD